MNDRTIDDGRDIDATLGDLEGEGAQVEVKRPDDAYPAREKPLDVRPAVATSGLTYYGLPAIKEPVWILSIPIYFYTGGVAGGALILGAASQLADREGLDDLVRASRWVGAGATIVSAGLLISDLGRPSRFLNMLRVFRPTSPMSVGSWVLAATGAFATLALLPGSSGDAAAIGAGILGIPLSGYTAVLLTNTAVPVWMEARTTLPILFVAGAIVGATSFLDLFSLGGRAARVTRRLGTIGKIAELAAGFAVEHATRSNAARVAKPLHEGMSGALWKGAKALTAASLVAAVWPGRSRGKRTAAAILGTLGTLAMRLAIFQAGKASAADPRATFEMQRA